METPYRLRLSPDPILQLWLANSPSLAFRPYINYPLPYKLNSALKMENNISQHVSQKQLY
jgi:hypothetical protein